MDENRRLLRDVVAMGFAAVLSFGSASIHAQVAGSTTIGVSKEEMKIAAVGSSARKILGKPVYNENKEKIGVVDDLIITPDRSVSYAIIGVGGFIGVGKHAVAIPVNQLKEEKDRFVLPGATEETLKAMPEFQYAKVEKD